MSSGFYDQHGGWIPQAEPADDPRYDGCADDCPDDCCPYCHGELVEVGGLLVCFLCDTDALLDGGVS